MTFFCTQCKALVTSVLLAETFSDRQQAFAFRVVGEETSKHFQLHHPEIFTASVMGSLLTSHFVLSGHLMAGNQQLWEDLREKVRTNVAALFQPHTVVLADTAAPEVTGHGG